MSNPDPGVLKISIQLRAGDHLFLNNSSENTHFFNVESAARALTSYSRFFDCAAEIEQWVLDDHPGKYHSVVWYLTTESKAVRHAARVLYGDKIITSLESTLEHSSKEHFSCHSSTPAETPGLDNSNSSESSVLLYPDGQVVVNYDAKKKGRRPTCEISQEGFQTAAAEWWMIGLADYHVITMHSGYGRTGAFRTLNKETIYTIDREPTFNAQVCDRANASQLESLMYDWAGI
jgi:hypothetical protein